MSQITTDSTAKAQSLANYLPTGEQWLAKNIPDSELRKLLEALGIEFSRMEDLVDLLIKELNVLETEQLITEWETAFGIPDECFSITNKTIEERRRQLKLKILMNGIQTPEDWENLASELGFNVNVTPAREFTTFPLVFPIPMVTSDKEAMYTIIVDFLETVQPNIFPMTFDLIFGEEEGLLLKCIFEKIKPANSLIVYRYFS